MNAREHRRREARGNAALLHSPWRCDACNPRAEIAHVAGHRRCRRGVEEGSEGKLDPERLPEARDELGRGQRARRRGHPQRP